MLGKHRDIFLPLDKKEIHYFDRDINYNQGLRWYRQHYVERQDERVIGDISPDYMLFDYVPERIHDALGAEVKLLFLLRHPVERAYSQYNYHRFFQVEKNYSFAEALENDADNVPVRFESWHTPPFYIYKSRYFAQITRFLHFFDKDQLHISIFEDLFGTDDYRASQEIRAIFNFLGIAACDSTGPSEHENPTFVAKNPALFDTVKGKIAPAAKRLLSIERYSALRERGLKMLQNKDPSLPDHDRQMMLNQYFIDDIRRLEDFTGRDLSIWYDR